MGLKKLYAEISKTEALADGSLRVWGYASSEVVDADGEVITADAMKAALPDYMKFGAVREMHQPLAAGTAIEAEVQDDGRTFFGAHVVDPVAVKKVQAGVYKGFSIGGKVISSEGGKITALRLVEVSLVDRPANPEAVFTLVKADDAGKSQADAAADADAKDAGLPQATKDALGVLHKALREACAHLDKLCGGDEQGKDQTRDQAGAQATDDDDDGKPAAAAREKRAQCQAIAKAAGLALPAGGGTGELAQAAIAALLDLQKRHAQVLASPAVPRGVVNTASLSKVEDRSGQAQGRAPVVKRDGTTDEVASLVKAAQAAPIYFA